MANGWYDSAKNRLINKELDLDTDDIRIVLIDTANYAVNRATHNKLADIPVAARVKEIALTGRTLGVSSVGAMDAEDAVLATVSNGGQEAEALVYYKRVDNGSGGTSETLSWPIAYIDTCPGLPVLPNGTNIRILFDPEGVLGV